MAKIYRPSDPHAAFSTLCARDQGRSQAQRDFPSLHDNCVPADGGGTLTELSQEEQQAAIHAKRVTVMLKDIKLATSMLRGDPTRSELSYNKVLRVYVRLYFFVHHA